MVARPLALLLLVLPACTQLVVDDVIGIDAEACAPWAEIADHPIWADFARTQRAPLVPIDAYVRASLENVPLAGVDVEFELLDTSLGMIRTEDIEALFTPDCSLPLAPIESLAEGDGPLSLATDDNGHAMIWVGMRERIEFPSETVVRVSAGGDEATVRIVAD